MTERPHHIDAHKKQLTPGDEQNIVGTTAFDVLLTRYFTASPQRLGADWAPGSKSASITVTRSTLTSIGTAPQQLASAWPAARSNRWIYNLFRHDRLDSGDSVIVPAQLSYGSISGLTGVAEEKPEYSIDLDPILAPIRKAAVWTKVTDETIEDFRGFASWMNSELTRMLLCEIDNQLINGTGTSPNLNGLLGTTGLQTQSKASDPLEDAITKAFAKVLNAGFMPTAILVSPNDFAELVAGDPLLFNGTFLSVPLVVSSYISDSLPVVGDFSGATIFERSALHFQLTNFNEDDFINNLTTIRAEQRLCLAVFAPKAFCKVIV